MDNCCLSVFTYDSVGEGGHYPAIICLKIVIVYGNATLRPTVTN